MNNPDNRHIYSRQPRSAEGAALILTLGMLVLLSGLVLAFLLTVRTEFGASKAYEGGTNARLLADSALNLVIGQVRQASTQAGKVWISQPGLIRTFDTDGQPVKSYKLYSADSLVEQGSFNPAAQTDLPATAASPSAPDYWKNQPGLWTDINAPVADFTRKDPFDPTKPLMTYPIFDGNHLKMATDLTTGSSAASSGSLQLSLNNDGAADIEGFKVTDKYSDGGASMPVKWLYMLKDGTLVPAKASGTGGDVEVLVPDNKKLTAQGDFNGVVARIAFWTDDESAKVNINTASEGTYWDTPSGASQPGKPVYQDNPAGTGWNPAYNATKPGPRQTYVSPYVMDLPKITGGGLTPAASAGVAFEPTDATFDWEYMHMTPGQREYQRYTGHPATTCLSTIFGRQLKLRIDPASSSSLIWQTRAKMCEEIYRMISRVTGHEYDKANDPFYLDETKPTESTTYPGVPIPKNYTSKAGTIRPKIGEILGRPPPGSGLPNAPATPPSVTPDADRLYASVDEFLYNPNFKPSATSSDQRNAWTLADPDPSGARDKTREMLEMSRFFLTANSKAPEQNNFNLPRISIWPLRVISGPNDTRRTAFDKVFAFCSTVHDPANPSNDLPFYFTRNNNEAPTGPADDYQSSVRNQQLMAYLAALTSNRVPGWNLNGAATSTFAAKFNIDHGQILAEIFDYIRCTNLCDMTEPSSTGVFPAFYSGDPKAMSGSTTAAKSRGYVNPIVISPTARGMGRSFTLSEMTLHVARVPDWTPPLSWGNDLSSNPWGGTGNNPNPNEDDKDGKAPHGIYQFSLIPSLYSVMAGYSVLGNSVRLSFKKIKFKVDALDASNNIVQTYYPFQGPGTVENTNSGAADIPQPTMYCDGYNGKVAASGIDPVFNGGGFNYSYGGQIGYRALLKYHSSATYGGGKYSCPPNALLLIKNIWDPVTNTRPLNAPVKLAISGTFDVEISSPAKNTPDNSTNEPVVQTLHFNFPQFTSLLPWSHYNNVVLGGPGNIAGFFNSPGNRAHTLPIATSYTSNLLAVSGGNRSKDHQNATNEAYNLYNTVDILRQLQATGHNIQGDIRLIAGLADVPDTYFQPCAGYYGAAMQATPNTLTCASEQRRTFTYGEAGFGFGKLVANLNSTINSDQNSSIPANNPGNPNGTPINGVVNSLGQPGDWDRGPFIVYDGALCNKADEGGAPETGQVYHAVLTGYMGRAVLPGNQVDFLDGYQTPGLFSPNRQIASAVMFGSLPTGVIRKQPWQTLLFRPLKSYLPGGLTHPGGALAGPPDHLLLDLFWMPVVEPYPISEPFATSGKVNLNQQIVPFTNIRRDTALRSVLKSVKITALNPTQEVSLSSSNYNTAAKRQYINWNKRTGEAFESGIEDGGGQGIVNRRTIDLDNTLKQISYRLDNNQPFVTASEICDIPLIPKDVPMVTDTTAAPAAMPPMRQHVNAGFSPSTLYTAPSSFDAKLQTFWAAHKLTGDNLLERPYTAIYPRLTTRSNSYTVHVRVQTLPPSTRNNSYILKATLNQPTGEFRGSFVLDRYLDPNTAGIYDVSDTTYTNKITGTIIPGQHVLGPYRFRVVSSKQFAP